MRAAGMGRCKIAGHAGPVNAAYGLMQDGNYTIDDHSGREPVRQARHIAQAASATTIDEQRRWRPRTSDSSARCSRRSSRTSSISRSASLWRVSARVHQARQLRQQIAPLQRFLLAAWPRVRAGRPARSIQRSRNGLAVFHRSSSGIELPAEAFDVEQRLLQQHQLRLDLDVEATRRLEQTQQHHAERNVLQRLVEHRLAARRALAPSSSLMRVSSGTQPDSTCSSAMRL